MKKTVSFTLLAMLCGSVFVACLSFRIAKADASSQPGLMQAVDTDWWPMFHHDLTHSGYSTSTAPTTNQTLWTYKTGNSVVSSPAVVNGIVYVGSEDDNLYALNATTGALVWEYETGNGVDSSPAVVNGIVYVGSEDGYVYALNATTGTLVWKYATGGAVDSSPAVVDGVVYVGSNDNSIYALDASTGAPVWNYTTYGSVASSPAVANGVVYATSFQGFVYALNASTGTLVWLYQIAYGITCSPAVTDGIIYVASLGLGPFDALNASTGTLVWGGLGPGVLSLSSPAVADGVVFLCVTIPTPGEIGEIHAFNATTGASKWVDPIGDSYGSPAVAGGVVFVGGDNKVLALNALNGALVWTRATPSLVESSPAVVDGVVYVGSDNGDVYAFGFNPIHSVAVTDVVPGKTVVGRGYGDVINVTVANQGGFTENCDVTVYIDATPFASQNLTLPVGTSSTTTLVWNTAGFAYGNYTITASVTLAPGETNAWTGSSPYTTVKVTIPGDINGDGVVNLKDLGVITAYWLQTVPPAPANADILNVGIINLKDLGVVTSHWQMHA